MNDAVDDVEVDGVLKLSEGAMNARVMGGTRYSRTHGSVIEEEESCGQLVETIDGVRLAGGEEEPGSEAPEENEGPVVAGHGRGCARCGERKPGCTCCTCFRSETKWLLSISCASAERRGAHFLTRCQQASPRAGDGITNALQ